VGLVPNQSQSFLKNGAAWSSSQGREQTAGQGAPTEQMVDDAFGSVLGTFWLSSFLEALFDRS
jgi:hypothetical protein